MQGSTRDWCGTNDYDARMQQRLMEILICPMCKGDLELNVEKEDGGEILTGSIRCTACGERYPIEDGIPNMLPPDQRG